MTINDLTIRLGWFSMVASLIHVGPKKYQMLICTFKFLVINLPKKEGRGFCNFRLTIDVNVARIVCRPGMAVIAIYVCLLWLFALVTESQNIIITMNYNMSV